MSDIFRSPASPPSIGGLLFAGRAPRLWRDQTVVVLATGPSLTREDVQFVRGKLPVLAIKSSGRLAPWADVKLIGHDGASAACLIPALGYPRGAFGLKYKIPSQFGCMAIALAAHLGAKRVLLLGFDMSFSQGKLHWSDPERPENGLQTKTRFGMPAYRQLAEALKTAGVEVINCSRYTRLKVFPRVSLAEALAPADASRA